jgi:hypothetical protein
MQATRARWTIWRGSKRTRTTGAAPCACRCAWTTYQAIRRWPNGPAGENLRVALRPGPRLPQADPQTPTTGRASILNRPLRLSRLRRQRAGTGKAIAEQAGSAGSAHPVLNRKVISSLASYLSTCHYRWTNRTAANIAGAAQPAWISARLLLVGPYVLDARRCIFLRYRAQGQSPSICAHQSATGCSAAMTARWSAMEPLLSCQTGRFPTATVWTTRAGRAVPLERRFLSRTEELTALAASAGCATWPSIDGNAPSTIRYWKHLKRAGNIPPHAGTRTCRMGTGATRPLTWRQRHENRRGRAYHWEVLTVVLELSNGLANIVAPMRAPASGDS